MKNVKQNIKKYSRFLLVILVIIFSNFQSGYSEWVKQDLINKLNLDLGTIQQFKINTKNELIVLNKDNEIITINFETGEISNRCKCEIDSVASYISMSSDGNYTIMQYYDKNLNGKGFQSLEFFTDFFVFNNSNCQIEKKISRDFRLSGGQYGCEIRSYGNNFVDYDFNSEKIIYNIWFSLKCEDIGPYNYFSSLSYSQIYDSKINEINLNLKSSYESILYDLNNFKNLYVSTSSSTVQSHPGNGTYYYFFNNTLASFNSDSNKLYTLMSNGYSESSYKNEPTKYEGKYFLIKKIFKHYNPDKLFLLVDTNRNNSNNKMVFYEYEISSKKLKSISELDAKNNSFVMDENNKLFKISNNIIELYNLNNGISLIDNLTLPDNIYNPTFSYSDNQTLLVFNNGNYIFKFTNDKLKHINNNGFTSDKQILNIDSNVTFVSEAKMKGLKFEWELEPNLIIKTDLPFVNYKFKNAGNYDIKLKVTDLNNKDYYYSKENYITVLPNLKANFSSKEDNGYPGIFHFENTSTGNPQSQSWYVNDSLISIEKNFSLKFYLFGDCKIKLIVNNEISSDTIEKVVGYRKNQKEEIVDSIKNIMINFNNDGLITSEIFNGIFKIITKVIVASAYYQDRFETKYLYFQGLRLYESTDLFSTKKYYEYRVIYLNDNLKDIINPKDFNISNIIWMNDSTFFINYSQKNTNGIINNIFANRFEVNYNYQNNKNIIDRSHKVDNNNINTFTLEQPDSILMRNITINPKAINSNYLTFDKNIKNFETEFRENINYLLLKYQDSTFSLNQYKFFAKKISDVINLPKSFEISKLSLKGDNLYILGNEPFADIKRGVIYKYNISTKGLEKYESDTYNNFTKIKWINDKSFVAWGEQSGSKGFVFMRNNLEVIKTNIYLNITGQINNIFFEDKKLTMVYENQAGSNFNVFIGEDELTDEFMEVLSNNEVSDEIIIYPNPTSNKIKILQQDKLFSISIYNITGLEVFSQQDLNSETEIDLGKLPTGNYWLKINNLDKMYSLQVNR